MTRLSSLDRYTTLLFLHFLNKRHESIKFTSELEKNYSISFLDIKICKTTHYFDTLMFRKNTFTGLMMKYDSAASNRNNFNLISYLMDRAYKIYSDFSWLCSKLKVIRKIFYSNSYPCSYIEKCFRIKLNSILDPPAPKLTAPMKPLFISIPFILSFN